MAAGDFSTSSLVEIKLKADEIYSGNTPESEHYKTEVDALKAILENQTAKIVPLNGYQEKDNTVGINWVDATGVVGAADATDNCTLTEAQLETKAIPVSLTLSRKSGFSVDEGDLRNSIFSREEVVAKGLLAAMKQLDEYLAGQALVFLATKKSTPVTGSYAAYTFDAPSKTIQIPAADWTAALYPQLAKTAIMNKQRDSYVLEGGDLYIPYQNALMNAGNGEGKGDAARIKLLPTYSDLFNFAASGVTPEDAYLVQKNAVAFAHKVRYSATPVEWPNSQKRYSIASKNLPGVEYEVIYQMTCGTNDELTHSFRLRVKSGFFASPTAVATKMGVIALAKV
jgi:hypothetical protein